MHRGSSRALEIGHSLIEDGCFLDERPVLARRNIDGAEGRWAEGESVMAAGRDHGLGWGQWGSVEGVVVLDLWC